MTSFYFQFNLHPEKVLVEVTRRQLSEVGALSKEWARFDRARQHRKWRPLVTIGEKLVFQRKDILVSTPRADIYLYVFISVHLDLEVQFWMYHAVCFENTFERNHCASEKWFFFCNFVIFFFSQVQKSKHIIRISLSVPKNGGISHTVEYKMNHVKNGHGAHGLLHIKGRNSWMVIVVHIGVGCSLIWRRLHLK